MGAFRVELSGFTDGMVDRLKALGLTSAIIAWTLRLFVPTGATGPAILGTLTERHPLVGIADSGAACGEAIMSRLNSRRASQLARRLASDAAARVRHNPPPRPRP